MAISPDELRKKTFSVVPKGYDRPEVNSYLAKLAEELRDVTGQGSAALAAVPNSQETTADDAPAQATPPQSRVAPTDDFDRVGTEISLMLRQAQESATKIRSDAEIEARALVDQVRHDIEADRVAHEQAAVELISRTEERANEIRVKAEDYAREKRKSAEEHAETRTQEVEAEVADAEREAGELRRRSSLQLKEANNEAAAIVADAQNRASEMLAHAEADAQSRSDEILDRARGTLQTLIDAETRTRSELDEARQSISAALDQLTIAELENVNLTSHPLDQTPQLDLDDTAEAS